MSKTRFHQYLGKMKIWTGVIFLSLASLFTGPAFSKASFQETKTYSEIYPEIESAFQNYGQRFLLVFDIDDTLLVTEHCRKKNGEMTKGFEKFFSCASHHTEPELAARIAEFQAQGVHTLALTARSSFLTPPTERELARVHENSVAIDFFARPFDQDFDSVQVPKTKRCKKQEEPPCLSGDFNDKPSFQNGVMYAQGNHKGLVLKTLLKLNVHYEKIIFIDDKFKNVEDMMEVYSKVSTPDVEIFHYTKYRR